MPELPEIETICTGIAPLLEGRTVSAVIVREPRLRRPVPASLADALPGQAIRQVERRGKYILLHTHAGTVIIHLGMSGRLCTTDLTTPPVKHDHVDLILGPLVLRYHDPRRFGMVDWWPGDAHDHPMIAPLGIEPFDPAFTGEWLHAASRTRRCAAKLMIMDAHLVVGVGNIYASESLFHAGIRPTVPAHRLSLRRCRRLADAIRETLDEAIAAGGSTLRDYVASDGSPGYFQLQAMVYDREGQACRVCGTPIRRAVLGQRSTFFCPGCQK